MLSLLHRFQQIKTSSRFLYQLTRIIFRKLVSFFLKNRIVSVIITILFCLATISGVGCAITNQISLAEKASYVGNSSVITRDSNPQSNIFKGFGFFPNLPYYPIKDRPAIVKTLFEDMKPHVIRIEFRANWSNGAGRVDANNEQLKKQIELLKIAASKGVTKWIGVHWSPPTEFRRYPSSRAIVDGKENSLRRDKEEDYAKYVAELVDVFVADGVPAPYGISIQNELTFAPSSWDGMKVSKDQFRRLVKLFRRELDAAGYGSNSRNFVRVQGPESGSITGSRDWMGGRAFSYLKRDRDFAKALSDVITHSYHPSKWSGGEYADDWRNGVLHHSGERDIWMTEMSELDSDKSDIDVAISMSREIGKHFGYMGTNYWVYWQGWHPNLQHKNFPGEILTVGDVTDELPKKSRFYHVMRLLINNTQPDSKIYCFRSNDNSLSDSGTDTYERYVDLLTFKGESKSVVLMVNSTAQDKEITVQGLINMGSRLDIYRVSDSEDGKKIGSRSIDQSGKVSQTIPLSSKSIVILVANDG